MKKIAISKTMIIGIVTGLVCFIFISFGCDRKPSLDTKLSDRDHVWIKNCVAESHRRYSDDAKVDQQTKDSMLSLSEEMVKRNFMLWKMHGSSWVKAKLANRNEQASQLYGELDKINQSFEIVCPKMAALLLGRLEKMLVTEDKQEQPLKKASINQETNASENEIERLNEQNPDEQK